MANKQLTIAVKSDVREGQKLQRFLADLAQQGSKTAKALQGVSLDMAGKDSKRGGLAKAMLESKKLFKELGAAGEDLQKILTEDVGKGAADATKRLADLNKKLKDVTDSYKRHSEEANRLRRSGQLEAASTHAALADARRDQMDDLMSQNLNARKMLGAFSGGSGLMGQLSEALGPYLPFLAGGTAIGAGLMAWRAGYGLWQNTRRGDELAATQTNDILATIGQSTGRYAAAKAWGDQSQVAWETAFGRTPGAAVEMSDLAKARARNTEYDNGRWKLFNEDAFGWGASFIPGTEEYLRAKRAGEYGAAAGEQSKAEFFERFKQRDPNLEAGLNWFYGDNQGRTMDMLRWGGSSRMTELWGMASKYRGQTPDSMRAIRRGLYDSIGSDAFGLTGLVAGANSSGMNVGSAISIAAGGAATAGGNTLSAVFGRALDNAIKERLGSNINSFLGADHMLNSPYGLATALASGTAGLGSAMQGRVLQQNMMGMQSLQGLFGGSDAWQQSVNLANSISVLGPGGSIYAQNKLANMDASTMIGMLNSNADVPLALQGLGINKDAMKGMMGRTAKTVLSRFADNPNDNTPAAQIARQIMGSFNGDIGAWGKSFGSDADYRKNAGMLSGLLSMTAPGMFPNESAAEGAINVLAGRPSAHGGKGGGAGKVDDFLETSVENLRRATDKAATAMDKVAGATDEAGKVIRAAIVPGDGAGHLGSSHTPTSAPAPKSPTISTIK